MGPKKDQGSSTQQQQQGDAANDAPPTTHDEILRTLTSIVQSLAGLAPAGAAVSSTSVPLPASTLRTTLPVLRSIPLPNLPSPDQLTISSFRDWRQRWQDYCDAQQLTLHPLTAQQGTLRSALHEDWSILWSSGRLNITASTTVKDAITLLERYIRQRRNPLLDRQEFHRRDQQPGESVDRYYAALKTLDDACAHETEFVCGACDQSCTTTCTACSIPFALAEFQQQIRIRDRLICGLRDREMQRKVLAEQYSSVLTLDRVLAICIAMENSTAVGATLSAAPSNKTLEANAAPALSTYRKQQQHSHSCGPNTTTNHPQPKKSWDPDAPCSGCGKQPRHRRAECPARDKACNNCGVIGHFDRVCRQTKGNADSHTTPPSQDTTVKSSNTVVATGAQQLLAVETVVNGKSHTVRWLPDTGSELTLLPESEFLLLSENARDTLDPTEISCVGANGIGLDPVGSLRATLKLKGRTLLGTIVVCRKLNAPLLSKDHCIALGLLPEEWPQSIVEPSSIRPSSLGDPVSCTSPLIHYPSSGDPASCASPPASESSPGLSIKDVALVQDRCTKKWGLTAAAEVLETLVTHPPSESLQPASGTPSPPRLSILHHRPPPHSANSIGLVPSPNPQGGHEVDPTLPQDNPALPSIMLAFRPEAAANPVLPTHPTCRYGTSEDNHQVT